MHIKKWLLVILCLFKLNLSKFLMSCSDPRNEENSICFTDETGYSGPSPVSLDVAIFLKDIISIDQDRNSISVHMDLMTSWTDLGLGLSEGPE